MEQFPVWLLHPEDPLAPKYLTDDIRQVVIREQLERIANRPDLTTEQMIEMLEEVGQDPAFLAVIESESIRRASQLRDEAASSIEGQAVVAAGSGLHGYHPQRFGSVEEMLQDALQETAYGSSEFYNLRTIITRILPFCRANGIEVPQNLWDDETKSKARYAADFLGPRLRDNTPDMDQITERFLASVVNPDISLSELKAEFPPTPASEMLPLEIFQYVERTGGVLLISYRDDTQRQLIERQLGKKAVWKFGTGTEKVLDSLLRRKGAI